MLGGGTLSQKCSISNFCSLYFILLYTPVLTLCKSPDTPAPQSPLLKCNKAYAFSTDSYDLWKPLCAEDVLGSCLELKRDH